MVVYMNNLNIIFESENIYYISVTEELINDYLKMYTNPDIQNKLFKKFFTQDQILKWLKNICTEHKEIFTMIDKKTHDFIGNIEIIPTKETTGEIIISITPAMQNKHYGTEAIKRIIEYGHETLKIENFVVDVYKTNNNAIHCYKKVGFLIDTNSNIEENVYHMVYKNFK